MEGGGQTRTVVENLARVLRFGMLPSGAPSETSQGQDVCASFQSTHEVRATCCHDLACMILASATGPVEESALDDGVGGKLRDALYNQAVREAFAWIKERAAPTWERVKEWLESLPDGLNG